MYVHILLLASIIILSQNSIFADAYSQDLDLKCNRIIDKNGDGIPDRIEAKSSINWSHCNLEGQDISKVDSFDYTESKRPFDKNGVLYDNPAVTAIDLNLGDDVSINLNWVNKCN